MKEFEIVYWPEQNSEFALFTDFDLSKLTDPITVAREEPVQEEELFFDKKKSELVDYEDEEYTRLREEEQDPLIITDAESRAMSGMFQSTSDSSMYFALVNKGSSLRMIPIAKWYKFVQKNQFSESGDVEKMEKNLIHLDVESEASEEEKEIDYVETFDDDNEEDNEVVVYMEKKLSSSGKKIQGIVESYDKAKDEEDEKEEHKEDRIKIEAQRDPDGDLVKKAKKEKVLTNDDIRGAFRGPKISVKDLLMNIKSNFKMGENEKKLIRDFIHENCMFEVDPVSGEKMFKLRN